MGQEEMLREINEILNDPEKKAKADRIIPLLHGKWEMQIMLEVCRFDVLRFGEIKKKFPLITNTVLTSALRNLERWNLLSRTQYNEIPPHVEYGPTEKGKSLVPVCLAILQWGLNHGLTDGEE
ncbi:MAG: helix-turn-helix domain-containing protein [Clostridia bacterium]|nr:helix-turn-helix domain-containing protein [Clostridia bacterium]